MRSFLTQKEATVVIVAGALTTDINTNILKNELTDEEIEAYNDIVSSFDKLRKAVFNRIDARGKQRLRSRLRNYVPKLVAIEDEKKRKYELDTDGWLDIVEFLLEAKCKGCTGKKRCRLRDILWKGGVTEFQIPDGKRILCEYQYMDCGISTDNPILENK